MFLLQQGWGMLSSISEFLNSHNNSGVVLSPRICEREQLERYLPVYTSIPNSELFFDPHFYEPRTDLERILSYPYFENFDFETRSFNTTEFCNQVIDYQTKDLNLKNIILPGRYTNSLSDSWLVMQHKFAEIGNGYRSNHKVYSSVAIGPDIILNSDNFNTVIDELINYPVDGIYLVYEHPSNEFLINEEFVYVLLNAILSISLSNKKILLGYGNHQSLIFFASGIDHLASGNYRNVRGFDHLNSTDRDNENLRKGIWYFDGNTFGEYKIPALGLAFRRNLRDHFGPVTNYNSNLLSSSNPTSVPWGESDAFTNYLDLMFLYSSGLSNIPKKQRANYLKEFFNLRRTANEALIQERFNFGDRGFNNYVNSTIDALDAFILDRGSDINNL